MKLAARSFLMSGLPVLLFLSPLASYPVDGYRDSGIRRLELLRLRLGGELKGAVPVEGGRKSIRDIRLHLAGEESLSSFPEPDRELQREVQGLFRNRNDSYSLALLDITPGRAPRFAALRSRRSYQPGSVGKLAVAVGFFTELSSLYRNSTESRRDLLRTHQVVADSWIQYDHHNVPLFDPETHKASSRPIREGDIFSLYEWLDHMLSASSNAAASTVWKEAILMRVFGSDYPPSREDEKHYFEATSRSDFREVALSVVNDPLRKLGIEESDWKLGSFFTRAGNRRMASAGSGATPTGLLTFLLRLKQGKVVDAWTSLELKRLMYMTARRVRYASAPRLKESAVYFKSGSLYRCQEEPGFECGRYRGNVFNYMNSVAIVEKPEGEVYLVALMSNVLRVNSAVEHQTLATYLDRILIRKPRSPEAAR